jgi:hypothetical protein
MVQFVGMSGGGGGSDITNRYSGSFDSPGGYGLQQGLDDRVSASELLLGSHLTRTMQYGDSQYGMNGDSRFQSGYGNGYDNGSRGMYQQSPNPGRYGIMAGGRGLGPEGKMNGFHGGAKHKRGEIDRECENTPEWLARLLTNLNLPDNRYAGSRLEDLIGEIPTMCKDQHGCRFLQKKLEEGIQEHRDIIFRETFNHFADLMTGMVLLSELILLLTSVKIPLATICARNYSNILRMSRGISSVNPSLGTSLPFP